MEREVLTDTVEDHHVVVDGVTDDRQDSGDEGLVHVQVERQDAAEQGEEADDDDRGVCQGHDAAETPVPALEAHRDVGEDDQKGEDDGDDGVALDVVGDRGAHLVGGDDTVGVLQRGGEVGEGHRLRVEVLQGLIQHAFDLGVDRGGLILELVGGRDLHLAVATELLDLDGGLGIGQVEGPVHGGADLLGGHGLVEADHIGAAAGEVDAIGEALEEHGSEGDHDEGAGDDVGPLAGTQEVDVRVLEEVLRELVLEGDALAALDAAFEDQAGDEDGGEHRGDDTDDERGREALDRTGAEEEEHETRQEGGHLAVDDGGVGVLVTVGDSLAQALAGLELFLDALVDDHVGVHGHTQRQDETGDTRQRQDGAEGGQGAEEQHDVGQQRDVRGHTRSLVEEEHVDEDEAERDQEGNETGADGLGTEGRADDLLLDDRSRGGQLTGLEDVGKVGGLLDGEVAGDGGGTSGNLVLDGRIGIDRAVEHDGDLAADVLLGQAGPDVGAFGVHGHGHTRVTAAALVVVHVGVGHDTAVERGLAVTGGGLDGDELVDVVALHVLGRLDGPHRAEFRGEDGLDLRHVEILVDLGRVGGGGEADAGVAAHAGRAEDRVERIGLAGGLETGVLGVLGLDLLGDDIVGGGSLGGRGFADGEDLREAGVGLVEVGGHFVIGERRPEFEGRSALEQLADTLRLLHARELHEDAAGVAELLDGRLRDAETVDTVAQDVERVGDGALGFVLDDGDDLLVGGLGLDAVAHLVGTEDLREAHAAGDLLPGVTEQGDEVGLRIDAALFGERQGLQELRGLVAAGEGAHQVLELDLQHDVHTALEVEAEVDLLVLDLLECITQINFLAGNGIRVPAGLDLLDGVEIEGTVCLGHGGQVDALGRLLSTLLGFPVLDGRHQGERQLPETGDQEANRDKSDSTFALHKYGKLNIIRKIARKVSKILNIKKLYAQKKTRPHSARSFFS